MPRVAPIPSCTPEQRIALQRLADSRTEEARLDNLSTHKKNDDWLAANPRVRFHFTPTSASWLNQIEIWFGILQRKALTGASFSSVDQLIQAITAFLKAHNQKAAPFV